MSICRSSSVTMKSKFLSCFIPSDCREFAQGGADSPDSQADQAANRFGRSGGNCGKRYLCAVNCKYNPADDTCLKTNCGSGK